MTRTRNVNKGIETATGLAEVHCWPTNDPTVVGIELIDVNKRTFTAAINTSGVVSVIGRLLDASVETVFCAASAMADGQPPQWHINGNRLELKSGRSPTEVALTVTIGCIQHGMAR